MTMYIRLKRRNQTVFLHIDMADNFYQIKQRVAELYALDPSNIQLIGSDKADYHERMERLARNYTSTHPFRDVKNHWNLWACKLIHHISRSDELRHLCTPEGFRKLVCEDILSRDILRRQVL
jgi:hypothetical protein